MRLWRVDGTGAEDLLLPLGAAAAVAVVAPLLAAASRPSGGFAGPGRRPALRACSTHSPGRILVPPWRSCRAARGLRSGLLSLRTWKGLAITISGGSPLPSAAAPGPQPPSSPSLRSLGAAPAWSRTCVKVAFQRGSPARCSGSPARHDGGSRSSWSSWRRIFAQEAGAPRAAAWSHSGVTTLQPAARAVRYLAVVRGS